MPAPAHDYERKPRTAANTQVLDMGKLTDKARNGLWALDEKYIGTDDYMGVAYFWNEEYKWWLRDAPPKVRRTVHAAFRKAHLKLDEVSNKHREVVGKFFPDALKRLEDMDE